MSILKIYDGYRFDPYGTVHHLERLSAELNAFRVKAREIASHAAARRYAKDACDLLDSLTLGRQAHSLSLYYTVDLERNAMQNVRDAAKAERKGTLGEGYRSPNHDWECKVLVYPVPGQPPLVRFLAEQRDLYQDTFESIEGMSEFWFDGRSRESQRWGKLSDADWEIRRLVWGRVFDGRTVLVTPFEFSAVDEAGPQLGYEISLELVTSSQPDLASRMRTIAERHLSARCVKTAMEAAGLTYGDTRPDFEQVVMGAHIRWSSPENAPAREAEIETYCQEIAPLLQPSYSLEDFRRKLRDVSPVASGVTEPAEDSTPPAPG